MADVTLFHNPNCSTSRAAREVLDNGGVDYDLVLYLKAHPDQTTLERILTKLEDAPSDLVRRDKFFTDQVVGAEGFDPDTLDDPAVVIGLLLAHPRLLQRPLIETPTTAIIGRPRERVPALFGLN